MVHRLYIDGKPKKGGADMIVDFLLKKESKICLLEHSLEYNNDSLFKILEKNVETILKVAKVVPSDPPFRWLVEIVKSITFVFINFNFIPCCIAVDPLNVITAWFLKKLKKIDKIYFHCIDYSESRFSNRIFNKIYLFLYFFALRKADISGVVSERMLNKFISLGIKKESLFFIPNSPIFKKYDIDFEKRNKFSLILAAIKVDDTCDSKKVIRVLAKLTHTFPQAEFRITGSMSNQKYLKELKEYIVAFQLENKVSFLGSFSKPDDLHNVLVNSGIGITAYQPSEIGHCAMYGDSLKIRQYASYGLPIVADGMCGTAFEAEKYECGFVVLNEYEMLSAIKRLWTEEGLYERYCKNAIKWSNEFDKKKIIEELLLRLKQ